MTGRPKSITVIGWLVALSAIIAVIHMLFPDGSISVSRITPTSFLPEATLYSLVNYNIMLTFISGFAILDGMDWGRWLYSLQSVTLFALNVYLASSFPALLILCIQGLAVLLIIYFLFTPKANDYFAKTVP